MAEIEIRQALPEDAEDVRGILLEAARWMRESGMEMWEDHELTRAIIEPRVEAGYFWIAMCDGEPGGVLTYHLSDERTWPDVLHDDSSYIHRLAVRRRFAGGTVSAALLRWSVAHTAELGRRLVRLDCDFARPRLRAVYERFGFRFHSEARVGRFHVARYEYEIGASAEEVP